jgi:hypothetical protein
MSLEIIVQEIKLFGKILSNTKIIENEEIN